MGYIESKKSKDVIKTNIGTPQGSVLSPLLANIVLHELDLHLYNSVIPEYHRGIRRRTNPVYNKLAYARDPKNRKATDKEKDEALKMMMEVPRMDIQDPGYRRSMYIRYADDFVYLFEGPIKEAEQVKREIKTFLQENIGLELNDDKTIITHIGKGFNFLGATIRTLKHVGFRMKTKTSKGTPISMRAPVRASVEAPIKTLIEKLIKTGFARRNKTGKILAKPLTKMINLDHATIIQFYNSKVYGLLNYYSFARNRIKILNLI